MSKTEFTPPQECAHCKNEAPMSIDARVSQVQLYTEDSQSTYDGLHWEEGNVFELLTCPACKSVTLRTYYWHDSAMEPGDVKFRTLYPNAQSIPAGLPEAVARAYKTALQVRAVDANLFGVQLGRVLELVCTDRGAVGDFLAQRIADLASKNEIPSKLVSVAEGLKQLRNVGAHPSLGDLTPAEIPVMEQLCRAILEYVYSAPAIAAQASASLDRLKKLAQKGAK